MDNRVYELLDEQRGKVLKLLVDYAQLLRTVAHHSIPPAQWTISDSIPPV